MSKYKPEERPLRCQVTEDGCQMTDASGQMLGDRCQQKEMGSRKREAEKGQGTKIPTQSRLSSVFSLLSSLLLLILATSCNPDRPNFEPSYSGAPPGEDLDQYLDTKAVFEGLDQVKGKRQQVDSLLTLADKLKNYDDDVALVYADTAYNMATEKNWQLSRGITSYYIALLKGRREKYGEGIEEALVDAEISRRIFNSLNEQSWLIRSNNLIGLFYRRKRDFKAAKEKFTFALELLDKSSLAVKDSLFLKGQVLHDLAELYEALDSIPLAEHYYRESYQYYLESDNKAGQARLQFDWAKIYYDQKQFDHAEELIQRGLKYAHDFDDINALSRGYQKLGILNNWKYRSFKKDEKYFEESMKSYHKCFQYQREDLYFLYREIGKNYQRRAFNNTRTEEQIYADVDSAIISYKLAMEEARKEGALAVMRNMGKNVSRLCNWRFKAVERDCKELLGATSEEFLNSNYAGLSDTIGHILQIANQRNRAFERNKLEVKNQQRSRVQWIISGASLLLIGLIFIVVLQRQQQRRLKAKMEALRAQINPHFISNSLNAIESLVNLDKKEAATKYLVHFSRLTRKVLNSSRDGKISLAEEIKTLEHFLELEQLRFRDKLRYLIDVDEDIDPKQVEMPAMILQPYIENAIWHGIKPKDGPGLVKVEVDKVGKHLVCTIKDDGVGRAKAAAIKASSVLQQNSVGMKINQERLNVVGRAKGAKVEIIDLFDEEGNASGTQVIIRLPYKEITKT